MNPTQCVFHADAAAMCTNYKLFSWRDTSEPKPMHIRLKIYREIMNEDLNAVNNWLNINKLKLNVNKTKAMWMNGKEDMNVIKMDGKVLEI